jgi:PmbA protein
LKVSKKIQNLLEMPQDPGPLWEEAPNRFQLQLHIKDTKHGLLVGRLWYTYAVNPIKGDFSCTARSGIRIIENGEITSPGKSVRIIHNLPRLLQNISAVGDNEKNVLQWASLPSITPSIKVEKIKVNSI